ncbi:30S ribosomal protein S17 [Neisseria bacilliformis ATCC BAA-1200]|uniref:30S ribosomal protein S17 n=1 Tax=Neisseria bacilliformis ATCC BAA-1200 TaxID=888742 RepID=F2BCJ0_9NEIS|nr:30S ribosomal protein S17 [Neisseria bacilliformis ATCC BAA-1200]
MVSHPLLRKIRRPSEKTAYPNENSCKALFARFTKHLVFTDNTKRSSLLRM